MCIRDSYNGAALIKEEEEDYDQMIYQCAHHQLLAQARAVTIGHEILPHAKIGGMLSRWSTYPATCHPDDVMQMLLDDTYEQFFYTDVMARGEYPSYMTRFFHEKGYEIEKMCIRDRGSAKHILPYMEGSESVSGVP